MLFGWASRRGVSLFARKKRKGKEDGPLLRLLEQVLQVEQRLLRRVHVDKRRCDSRLARPTGAADLVDVVLDLLRHRVVLRLGRAGEETKVSGVCEGG